MPDLTELADRWQADLAAGRFPEHITASVSESPWVLPQVFARRADRLAGGPSGPSYEREWAALDPPGSVLDVGAGAGAALAAAAAAGHRAHGRRYRSGHAGTALAAGHRDGHPGQPGTRRWPEVARGDPAGRTW